MLMLAIDARSRRALVVGGGAVATRKITYLLDHVGHIDIVSPDLDDRLRAILATRDDVTWHARSWSPDDLEEPPWLVVAATDDRALNERIARRAAMSGCLVNAAHRDVGATCTFPAVASHDAIEVGVITGGDAPALSARFRDWLAPQLGVWARAARALGQARDQITQSGLAPATRHALWRELVAHLPDRGPETPYDERALIERALHAREDTGE